jgi:hypothetical protein
MRGIQLPVSAQISIDVCGFCHLVAAWVADMFYNFYLVKNHKIAKNSKTTNARKKMSTDLES